jgi:hypothetical protein
MAGKAAVCNIGKIHYWSAQGYNDGDDLVDDPWNFNKAFGLLWGNPDGVNYFFKAKEVNNEIVAHFRCMNVGSLGVFHQFGTERGMPGGPRGTPQGGKLGDTTSWKTRILGEGGAGGGRGFIVADITGNARAVIFVMAGSYYAIDNAVPVEICPYSLTDFDKIEVTPATSNTWGIKINGVDYGTYTNYLNVAWADDRFKDMSIFAVAGDFLECYLKEYKHEWVDSVMYAMAQCKINADTDQYRIAGTGTQLAIMVAESGTA